MYIFSNTQNFLARIIFLILLGASPLLAQTGVTVSGTIKDQNEAVVQGATVRLLNLGNSQETTATTDSTGKYEFMNVLSGSYRLSASMNGFAESAESLTIINDGITRDFALSPGSITDVVTVTAGKGDARIASEVPQTVTVTTEQQLEERRPRSTFEAIERTPNIIVRETNPARERPRLRGLDSSRVLIVIDGEKLNNARTDLQTGLSPSIVDVTQLSSAEVVSGAGSSLYGSDSLAGTINFITKGPERPDSGVNLGFRLDGNYSSNGAVRRGYGVVNLSNKQVAFRIGGSLFRNDNYNIGNREISLAETVAFGNFFTSIPTNIPNLTATPPIPPSFNGPSSYAVFSVPAGGEILNGAGHGGNGQIDLWFYPVEKHSFRGRYILSDHKDLGDAFSGPPYETQQRFNSFRQFDKFGLRYEGLDLTSFIPRVSVNFYRQKLSFPQDQFEFTNQAPTFTAVVGGIPTVFPSAFAGRSSYSGNTFTGLPSTLTLNSFTSNKNTITTENIDAQATFQPFTGLLVTVGAQNLRDNSQDEFVNYGFFNFDFNRPNLGAASVFAVSIPGVPVPQTFSVARFQRGASSPNTRYEDRAAFFQAEFDRIKWFRLTGGMRVDNWRTKASPSDEFPLGNEFSVLQLSLPQLQANPGPLSSQVAAIPQLITLAGRTGEIETDNTTITGSIGAVLRLPYGINPYIRYGTSYREPSITERYIIRIFPAFPGLVAPVVGNPNLEPETGRTVDFGVKAQGRNYSASFGYFRNNLKNLIIFQTPDFGNICLAPNPTIGLLPLSAAFVNSARPCAVGQSAVSFNGRINQANNVIDGFEGTGEYSQSLGNLGSINPFVSFGTLHGENKSPTALNLYRLQVLQSRTNNPIEIGGSADDFPLGNITPLRLIGGARYTDESSKFFVEYSFRHQRRVTRIDPNSLTGTTLVNFGTYASFNGFTKHDIRGGYTFRASERFRLSLTAGIQNFTGKLYWEQFQNAPAPGRSFLFGFTTEFFNLLGNK